MNKAEELRAARMRANERAGMNRLGRPGRAGRNGIVTASSPRASSTPRKTAKIAPWLKARLSRCNPAECRHPDCLLVRENCKSCAKLNHLRLPAFICVAGHFRDPEFNPTKEEIMSIFKEKPA